MSDGPSTLTCALVGLGGAAAVYGLASLFASRSKDEFLAFDVSTLGRFPTPEIRLPPPSKLSAREKRLISATGQTEAAWQDLKAAQKQVNQAYRSAVVRLEREAQARRVADFLDEHYPGMPFRRLPAKIRELVEEAGFSLGESELE